MSNKHVNKATRRPPKWNRKDLGLKNKIMHKITKILPWDAACYVEIFKNKVIIYVVTKNTGNFNENFLSLIRGQCSDIIKYEVGKNQIVEPFIVTRLLKPVDYPVSDETKIALVTSEDICFVKNKKVYMTIKDYAKEHDKEFYEQYALIFGNNNEFTKELKRT